MSWTRRIQPQSPPTLPTPRCGVRSSAWFQVVVEAAMDAGDLLLAEEGRMVGETAREIFEALHTAGVIDDARLPARPPDIEADVER